MNVIIAIATIIISFFELVACFVIWTTPEIGVDSVSIVIKIFLTVCFLFFGLFLSTWYLIQKTVGLKNITVCVVRQN